jgi:aryl-alcohol dehydrogenase-like predicted oxidoreductase
MKYQIFGQKSGLRVSELALGTGNFGTKWGVGSSKEESRLVFDKYIEAGGNFIDTADGYQLGQAEEFLGDFIAGQRENLVLASKYTMGGATKETTGNSRKTMMHAVEQSLKRLKTDYLDLYWVHLEDGQTPIEEIVRGLDDLVRAGKINYAGFSNFPAWRIANASLLADLRGWAPVTGIQIEYNLLERTAERELLPMAEALGLGVTFWSPLAGGTLTGKYRTKEVDPNTRRELLKGVLVKDEKGSRETAIIDMVESIAQEKGVRVMDVSLAWVRQRYAQSPLSTFTIIGPRTLQQLEDNLASLKVELTNEELARLSEVSKVDLGSPHEVIATSQARMFGKSSGEIAIKHAVA